MVNLVQLEVRGLNMNEIYGFVGEMGSGKTYYALQKVKELKSDGKTVLMISWADPIKSILYRNFGLLKSGQSSELAENLNKLSSTDFIRTIRESITFTISRLQKHLSNDDFEKFDKALKENENILIQIKDDISNNINYDENFRKLIQIVGTEIGRSLYNNIWIDSTLNDITLAFDYNIAQCAIIDDIRFRNEMDKFYDFGILNKYTTIIYGINSTISTRAERLMINPKDLEDFRKHDSEKNIIELLSLIPKQFQIYN
jgi:hypothetical protein